MQYSQCHALPSKLRISAFAALLAISGSAAAQVASNGGEMVGGVNRTIDPVVRPIRSLVLPGAPASAPATHRDSTGGVTSAVSVNSSPPSCPFGQVFSGGSCVPLSSLTHCPDSPVTWGQGCSANLSRTAHGFTQSVSAASPHSGSATYQCDNGSWRIVGSPTCAINCPDEWVSWGREGVCRARLSGDTHGSIRSVSAASPYSGSAVYQCDNGSWRIGGSPRCGIYRQVQGWVPCTETIYRCSNGYVGRTPPGAVIGPTTCEANVYTTRCQSNEWVWESWN